MDLYIIRHAWAGHFGDPAWTNDAQRPLTDEGRERFAHMVQAAGRARAGAGCDRHQSVAFAAWRRPQLLAEKPRPGAEIVVREELLSGGRLEDLLAWTVRQAREHEQIAWVGHCPDVDHHAAAFLAGSDGWIRFGKGTIAALRFEGPPRRGAGQLRWLVTAKVLGC